MKIVTTEVGWSIGLETREEALALLAAQETPLGNRALSTTDPNIDRVTPGRNAIALLHFAELVLPPQEAGSSKEDSEVVEFPFQETQHLSGLLYGATRSARESGKSVTNNDALLFAMEAQVESFFDMDY